MNRRRLLVVGVYLLDVDNHAEAITAELASSQQWEVDVRWVALGSGPVPEALREFTVEGVPEGATKFQLINRLVSAADLEDYDYLAVTDDDIELPAAFVDTYLDQVCAHDLDLAQPARTHDSYVDHHFVTALEGVVARATRFVEIGPLFSLSRRAFPHLLPFDESAPMGWGLDSVWPVLVTSAGLRMGIVDATPVRHALRKPVELYDYDETDRARCAYLERNDHLSLSEACVALETYPVLDGPRPDERAGTPHAIDASSSEELRISAVVCTRNRAELLRVALGGLCGQTLPPSQFEVIVIDDGSTDQTRTTVEGFRSCLPVRYAYQTNAGLASGKNHGLFLARAPIVVFLDDDDVVDPLFLSKHVEAHDENGADHFAVLGHTDLISTVRETPLMRYVTEVGCHLFSYGSLSDGDVLDFSHFWGGRSSCKRMFLLTHGVFNPVFRFGAEDIELGYRLGQRGLQVVYRRDAVSHMLRELSFEAFCRRCYRQGRSNKVFSLLHPDPKVSAWTEVEGVEDEWTEIEPRYESIMKIGRDLDLLARERLAAGLELDGLTTRLLHRSYEAAFRAARIKGTIEMGEGASLGPHPSRHEL